MKRITAIILISGIFLSNILSQEAIIIDHNCLDLSSIPSEWIVLAKANLHIGYGHTSHGSQLISGMDALETYFADGTYDWSHEGGTNQLHLFEGSGYDEGDLDEDVGYPGWDDETREYLDANPGCNVIIWSWCGQVDNVVLQTHYFEPMEQLESEYPDVTFVYMTGHLEGSGLTGSVHTANEQIRNYCIANDKILFDFADIESYDPDGNTNYNALYATDACYYDPDGTEPIDRSQNWATNWVNANPTHELRLITNSCSSCAHSLNINCVKKGIACWFLWTRIAGWDGNISSIPVTTVNITSTEGATTISTAGGTLQLSADVLPADASNKTILWSVQSGTGQATISPGGLFTAVANGTVTVTASATDGSGVSDTFIITISNQVVLVNSITITSVGGATTISTAGGTLQLAAEVLPATANNKTVLWSIQSGTGQATISPVGLVTAVANGTVTVTASATDGSGVSDTFTITISNQVVLVNSITITSAGGATTITTAGGTLQLAAEVLPATANNKTVLWSIQSGTGQATISPGGLVTAVANGTVTVTASATDGSGVSDTFIITISNQVVLVNSITITSAGGATTITTAGGTLQLAAEVLPATANNKTVLWSIQSGTGQATISPGGLVTAVANGTVTITASATDGSGVSDTFIITISNQVVLVNSITITSAGGATTISTAGGTLQLAAEVLPATANSKTVLWSIQSGTGQATISPGGLVTAVANGTVTVTASATDGSDVSDTFIITISNQVVLVSSINITSANGLSIITELSGTLQLNTEVLPANASNKTVLWSVQNGTGQATVSSTGLVTAVAYGTVDIFATATDDSEVSGTFSITISEQAILVSSINIISSGNATTISTADGTMQLSAEVLPEDASNKTILWSVQNVTGQATVNSNGLVTAVADGAVTVTASATDGSGVSDTFTITISNQVVLVNSINITSTGGVTTITTSGGTLQLAAEVLPANASNKTVLWSVQNGTGQAIVNFNGLVTAIAIGTITVTASATDGSGISDAFTITISNQVVLVNSINITSTGGATTITTAGGTLQLAAEVLPASASNKTILWSVQSGTGQATVNSNGLVTAIANGTITVTASATDGSGISDAFTITISNQVVLVSSINIYSSGGVTTITTTRGTLQLYAEVLPSNVNNKTILWSIQNGSGQATVNSNGLVTAIANGTVTVTASATDGSGVSDAFAIAISNQVILASSINITSVGGVTAITTAGGTLQLTAEVLPVNANNKKILWSVQNSTGQATVNSNGLITAVANGTVTVTASATDGSGVSDAFAITISNQMILASSINITSAQGATTITTAGGTLQLFAEVLPDHASNKTVLWSVQNGVGQANVGSNGLVTAIANGTVTVTASATDGSGVSDVFTITISNQMHIDVSDITVTSEGDIASITVPSGTLQLYAEVLPSNASNKSYTWELVNVSGIGTISTDGVVTAHEDGSVYAKAISIENQNISDYLVIVISGQIPLACTNLNNDLFYKILDHTIFINYKEYHNQSCVVRLLDTNGHIIMLHKISSENEYIKIPDYKSGIYILQFIISNSQILNRKVFLP